MAFLPDIGNCVRAVTRLTKIHILISESSSFAFNVETPQLSVAVLLIANWMRLGRLHELQDLELEVQMRI